MSSIEWSFPNRIVFGAGSVAETDTLATDLHAESVLLISDEGIVNAGLHHQVVTSLENAGIGSTLFSGVNSNPVEADVEAATAVFHQCHANLIIGLGGGSVLDVAKLVRVTATHPAPLEQYDDQKGGSALIVQPLPPMIAIPTTAGTGSEVGRSSVLTLRSTQKKTVFFAPSMLPEVAILDPMLTIGLPPALTAATGVDALTHCIESYCAQGDHPMADALALQGLELCGRYLTRAVKKGSDVEARGAMLKASMMGAVAFQKGLGVCHSLAHPLSAIAGLHHGLANALCLPATLEFNQGVIPDKLARIAELLEQRQAGATGVNDCATVVRAFLEKIGIELGLSKHGVQDAQIPVLAEQAFEDACHLANPRPCTLSDIEALYWSAMS